MSGRKKILYFHPGLSSFVVKDIAILDSAFDVKIHYFPLINKSKVPFALIKQFFILLLSRKKGVVAVSQFAGYHSLLPALFSRFSKLKSAIVLGGTDCVSFPSIGYGNFSKKMLGAVTAMSMKYSDLLLPVDETLVHYQYTFQPNDGNAQGYLAHRPDINTPYQVIHNGYDASKWVRGNQVREKGSFTTIGANLKGRTTRLKGLDLITEAARLRPECKFYVVGGKASFTDDLPGNMIMLDLIPNQQLNAFLQTKEFYLQLSLSEGFPNALCESMLSGCIPIVSNVAAMPQIVGESGFILQKRSVDELLGLIDKACALDPETKSERSRSARKNIEQHYPIALRSSLLIAAINDLQ